MDFIVAFCQAFRRDDRLDRDAVEQPRPCIVPLTDKAAAFLVAARKNLTLRPIFGPFYVGGLGGCRINDTWTPCLRFVTAENIDMALGMVQEAFAHATSKPRCPECKVHHVVPTGHEPGCAYSGCEF